MQAVEVMAEASRDNRDRLNAAVRAYGPRLQSFIRHRVRDVADAEDLAQDVLAEFAAVDVLQPIERVAGWLLRVARNRIIDRYRARAREAQLVERGQSEAEAERLLDAWAAPAADGPAATYERARMLDALEAALAELPAAQREVFVAHELEGRSFKELAAASGESVNTLLGRKHAAVQFLRDRLRDQQLDFED